MFPVTRIQISKAIVVCQLYLKATNIFFDSDLSFIDNLFAKGPQELADTIRRLVKIYNQLCFNLGLLRQQYIA
jgi:hypothetical protein